RSAVEVEEVEDLVHERRGRDGRSAPALDPGLEQGEVGFAVLVERDDLAVDDRPACIEPGGRIEERPEVARGVLLATRPQPDVAVIDERLDPEAVPRDLEHTVRLVEGWTDERPQHRGIEGGLDRHRTQPTAIAGVDAAHAHTAPRIDGPV